MPKLQEKLGETAGNGLLKVSMLRGSFLLVHFAEKYSPSIRKGTA